MCKIASERKISDSFEPKGEEFVFNCATFNHSVCKEILYLRSYFPARVYTLTMSNHIYERFRLLALFVWGKDSSQRELQFPLLNQNRRNMTREEVIRLMCEEEPFEVFNWYALLLELKAREADKNEIFEITNKILTTFPDYLPVYYFAGSFFAENDLHEEAKNAYEKGMKLAKKLREEKTYKELKTAYESFIFEHE
jgi:hypothetical protein